MWGSRRGAMTKSAWLWPWNKWDMNRFRLGSLIENIHKELGVFFSNILVVFVFLWKLNQKRSAIKKKKKKKKKHCSWHSEELVVGDFDWKFLDWGSRQKPLPRRCPWCNGYRLRIWTRRHDFKSWTRLIAFLIALIPLGKIWIQLFSLQLWVNSRTD